MPTYEYECSSCGHMFEAFQSITAKALSKCPKCSKKVRRLISAGAGIIFKGAGFYATDYKKEGNRSQADRKDNRCSQLKEGCNGCPHKQG